ncbi:MAG: hypothetical protein KG029_18475 [Bacteroidetes bacterium]|jgi:hypothetical protein|nr:hypothetical protein [Bacteroidota bacterium]
MKKNLLLFSILLFSFIYINAQESKTPFEAVQVERKTSAGEATGWMIFVPDAQLKTIENDWKSKVFRAGKYSKKDGDPKPVYTKDDLERIALHTSVNELYPKPIIVYAFISSAEGGVKVSAFFNADNDFASDSLHEDLFASSKNFMREFLIESVRKVKSEELKNEKNKLKSLEKEQASLKKQRDKYEKSIVKSSSDIVDYENQVKTNLTDQKLANDHISDIKLTLASVVPDTEAHKEFTKRQKSEEKKLKSLVSKNKSLQSKIGSAHQSIRSNKEKIEQNIKNQERQSTLIEQQATLISQKEKDLEEVK